METKKLTHGSLFSGIGGFDVAAEWAGWENKFHCEWNEFGKKVLNYYWPKAESYGDITKTDFSIWRGRIDVLSGGFPCQPYSLAGKRLGKEDERHLWPEMLRAIREIQPKWVVGENVFGIINWNGGLVFNEVQADLEAEGYEVQPYVLPAVSVNAPHRRDRVWFVAYRNSKQRERQEGGFFSEFIDGGGKVTSDTNSGRLERSETLRRDSEYVERKSGNGFTSHPNSLRYSRGSERPFPDKPKEWQVDSNTQGYGGRVWGETKRCGGITPDTESTREQGQRKCEQRKIQSNRRNSGHISTDWKKFPTQPPVCGGDDGLPRELDRITFPKWRAESIKAYGNAIVPQVAFQIFKAINEYESITQQKDFVD